MMNQEFYNQISQACCYITVFFNDELISEGTGFAFTQDGQIMTAGHVITGRMPLKHEDYNDSAIKIFAKFPGKSLLECRILICGVQILFPAFKNLIQIDQAIIKPINTLDFDYPILKTIYGEIKLGEEVLCAGYSDELEIPFQIEKNLKPNIENVDLFYDAMKFGYLSDMTGPIIKRGYISNIRQIQSSGSILIDKSQYNIELSFNVFMIDTSMHSGASGGPIMNKDGEIIGILTKRAITSVSQKDAPTLKVPSGSTIGISFEPIHMACTILNHAHNLKLIDDDN